MWSLMVFQWDNFLLGFATFLIVDNFVLVTYIQALQIYNAYDRPL